METFPPHPSLTASEDYFRAFNPGNAAAIPLVSSPQRAVGVNPLRPKTSREGFQPLASGGTSTPPVTIIAHHANPGGVAPFQSQKTIARCWRATTSLAPAPTGPEARQAIAHAVRHGIPRIPKRPIEPRKGRHDLTTRRNVVAPFPCPNANNLRQARKSLPASLAFHNSLRAKKPAEFQIPIP